VLDALALLVIGPPVLVAPAESLVYLALDRALHNGFVLGHLIFSSRRGVVAFGLRSRSDASKSARPLSWLDASTPATAVASAIFA